MLLILSTKSKNIFKTYSHSRGEWSLIIRYTLHSHSKLFKVSLRTANNGAYGSQCRLMKDTVLEFFCFRFASKMEIMKKLAIRVPQYPAIIKSREL